MTPDKDGWTWTTIPSPYGDKTPPLALLGQLYRELVEIYGTYCETRSALSQWKRLLERQLPTDFSVHWRRIFFGRKAPEHPFQHSRLMTELIYRLGEEGPNAVRLREGAIAFSYSVWEHGFRPELEDRAKQTIASDVFGDLRLYRQALAHRDGILEKPTKVLRFVEAGTRVTLSDAQFYELFKHLVNGVNEVAATYFGSTHRYNLDIIGNL